MKNNTAAAIQKHVTMIDGVPYQLTGYKAGQAFSIYEQKGYKVIKFKRDKRHYTIHLAIIAYAFHNNDFELEGFVIDHKDRNQQNDDPSNLRKITSGQNRLNSKLNSNSTTGFKGVQFDKARNKFKAVFSKRFVGRFDTAIEAARAHDRAASGTLATTNRELGLI